MLENKSNDEDISLTDFIFRLWNGKWILFFSILFFILISHIFLYFNNSFKGIIEIKTIDSNEENKYEIYKIAQLLYFGKLQENLRKYNSFITDETFTKGEKYSDILFLSFDRNDLLEKFIEQINDISLNTSRIKNIILTSNFLNDEEFENKNKYENEITSIVISIDSQFHHIARENKIFYKLSFQFNEIKIVKNLLNELFSNYNLEVRERLIHEFENLVLHNQQITNEVLEMLYKREKQVVEEYNQNIKYRIAYLVEQSKIAKKINLKKDSIFSISESGSDIVNLLTDSPLYLRGYESIDEEIKLIKNRKDIKTFIPEIFEIYQGIEYFKNKTPTEDLQKMFNKTPVYSIENFKSVFFNTNKLTISSKYNSIYFYVLSLLFGFLLALFIIFVKDIITNTRKSDL